MGASAPDQTAYGWSDMTIKPTGRYRSVIRAIMSLPFACAVSAAFAEPIEIVGFGDSLMAGYDLAAEEGFPEVLERELTELGYEVDVLDAGVSGDTTSGGRSRLEWSVPESADIVILELGGNDALRGIDPAITRENIDAMLDVLRVRDQRVVLAGMLAPPNLGTGYEAAFNAIYPDLAEARNVPLYPFFLDGAMQEGLMLPDRIHPSAEGVELMVERFLPTLLPVLDEVTGASAAPGGVPPTDPVVPAAPDAMVPETATPQAPAIQ